MKKITFTFLFLFSCISMAQRVQVVSQDNGLTINHSTCRIFIDDQNESNENLDNYNLFITDKDFRFIEKSFLKKGYRLLNQAESSDTISSANPNDWINIAPEKDDLILKIDHGYASARLYSHEDSHTILSNAQISDLTDLNEKDPMEKLINAIPTCNTIGNGLMESRSYEPLIRDYELRTCRRKFMSPFHSTGNSIRYQVSRLAGIPIGMGLIIASPTAPVIAIGAGLMFFGDRLFGMSVAQKELMYFDGYRLLNGILKCQDEESCNKRNEILFEGRDTTRLSDGSRLSKKSQKKLKRYLKRMSFQQFSKKVSDYIVLNQACSRSEEQIKNYKKLFNKARKSF